MFSNIKNALANASLLCHPTSDAPTSIMTYASDVAVGVVLQQSISIHSHFSQRSSNQPRPAGIAHYFDRKLLAIYLAIR